MDVVDQEQHLQRPCVAEMHGRPGVGFAAGVAEIARLGERRQHVAFTADVKETTATCPHGVNVAGNFRVGQTSISPVASVVTG